MTYTPFFTLGEDRQSRWLITCDHACNTVPDFIADGDLGLPHEDMERHIAYDPGAWEVAKHLGHLLDAPVIGSNFSRLVIDPNRGEDDPTLLMKLSDGSIIPGNRTADTAERERRLDHCYRPYDRELARLAAIGEEDAPTIILSIHSFTRQFRGRPPRPWEIGILYPSQERFSPTLIELLINEGDLCVGENQPYTGYLPGDAIDRHGSAHGRPNALIEVRNDLISDHVGQVAWAERLAPILLAARDRSGV
ncbi:MAG: N-formylglutamate amidohydrolase [Paracoccaceae bacterium]